MKLKVQMWDKMQIKRKVKTSNQFRIKVKALLEHNANKIEGKV